MLAVDTCLLANIYQLIVPFVELHFKIISSGLFPLRIKVKDKITLIHREINILGPEPAPPSAPQRPAI